jgi:hypothetical protein
MDIQSEINRIHSFIERDNFHAAVNLAISGLNECRRNDDQDCVDTFLRLIHTISITMTRVYGSQACIDELSNK